MQIAVHALFLSYQMFIWPLANHYQQVIELMTLVLQLMLLVCFTFQMGERSFSLTMESVIVGALSCRPPL
jgi:hypothetical protein